MHNWHYLRMRNLVRKEVEEWRVVSLLLCFDKGMNSMMDIRSNILGLQLDDSKVVARKCLSKTLNDCIKSSGGLMWSEVYTFDASVVVSIPSTYFRRMKKIILLILATTFVGQSEPVQAQFGIRGGINLTDFFTDGEEDTEARQGLNIGVAFTLIKLGPIHVIAEGYYSEKGSGQDIQGFNPQNLLGLNNPEELELLLENGGTLEYGLDYVELPILARINLPTKGMLRPYINGGPSFAWQIDCGFKANAVSQSTQFDCSQLERDNIEETLRDYEVGMVLGGGVDLALGMLGGTSGLNLDIRYNRGLSRLAKLDGGVEVTNTAWTAMLGYFVGL